MADVKISQLTEVTASGGADLVECVQSGASRRTTVQKLLDWIKAQATTWTGKQTFQGFTVLGESAPAVKMKLITGTTAGSQGGVTTIAHGLAGGNIIGIQAIVEHVTDGGITPGVTAFSGYQYDVHLTSAGAINVTLSATNSSNILAKPFRILLMYKE